MATFLEHGLARVNGALVTIFDALLAPIAALPSLVGLLLLSLLTALIIVPVIGRTTPQARVRETKRRLQAALLEIRLFNDDPRLVVRAVRDALRHNLRYLRLSALSIALVGATLVPVVTHLHAFYGYTGLTPGSPALLTVHGRARDVRLDEAALSLHAPDAVRVETGPVTLVGGDEVLWRITPAASGNFTVVVHAGGHTIRKTLHVSHGVARRSPARVQPGVSRQLIYPSEPPLDSDGVVSQVTITYPEARVHLLGLSLHWSVVYLALTMAWALVVARVLGISL